MCPEDDCEESPLYEPAPGAAIAALTEPARPANMADVPGWHALSGTWHGTAHGYRVEVLIDCENARLSADFYRLLGGRSEHLGWCFVRSAIIERDLNQLTVKGVGRYSFGAAAPLVEFAVARTRLGEPRAPGRLRFLTTQLSAGATYLCRYVPAAATDPVEPTPVNVVPFPGPRRG